MQIDFLHELNTSILILIAFICISAISVLFIINSIIKKLRKVQENYSILQRKINPLIDLQEEIEKLKIEKQRIINQLDELKNEFNKKEVFFDDIIQIEEHIKILNSDFEKRKICHKDIFEIEKEICNRENKKKLIEDKINSISLNLNEVNLQFEQRNMLFETLQDIENSLQKKVKDKEDIINEIDTLKEDYKSKKLTYDNIVKELSILDEDLEDLSFGLYKPHFDFEASEKYKEALISKKQQQRIAVHNKEAAKCYTNWTVNESVREGTKMTNRNIKLMLRAFNGECDTAVLNVRWNNILKYEERLKKSFELINKLGETNSISIQDSYLKLKLDELRLTHEYKEKQHEEKEEQRRIHRQMREEQKVQKEIEIARREAEKEEIKYNQLLLKANEEVHKKHGEELIKFNERIKQLEMQLFKARELKERAISRAQITKSGHVYIVSNIGAFGKDVFKIGMTRRLEPIDRIYELSGASVPFSYDVHGMIYSEDAPSLENELHKRFEYRRLNRVNARKEFFKVSISEIEDELKKINDTIELIKIAEARQYRETLKLNEDDNKEDIKNIINKFPDEL